MVHLAGDNNLTSEGMFALTEMQQATLGSEINVIAQFDPNERVVSGGRWVNRRSGLDPNHEPQTTST